MMNQEADTERLVYLASKGDASAEHRLMDRHRDRLKRMVAVHLDPRISARVDPSDVVQETLIIAFGRLSEYLRDQPIPFYPWLRQIAWNRLVDLHRIHVKAKKRSVRREENVEMALSVHSANRLAQRLIASGISPSEGVLRDEMRRRMRAALERLPVSYRQVLVMRQLERMSTSEIAATLGIAEGTVKSRHFRALEKIRTLMNEQS